MGYMGDWSNLNRSLDKVRENISKKKGREPSVHNNKSGFSSAAKFRTRISLVEKRNQSIIKIRIIAFGIILIAVVLLSYFL